MIVKEYIQKGHKWTDLKGVPVRDVNHGSIQFIHNNFFEGKELKFQESLISECKKKCPEIVGEVRVYGGNTPDADMVDWIYTQCAEIVKNIDAVYNYLIREGFIICSRSDQVIRGFSPTRENINKVARIFGLKREYCDTGEFALYGFDKQTSELSQS